MRIILLLIIAIFSSSCNEEPEWTENEKLNAAHFFRALQHAQKATSIANKAVSDSNLTSDDIRQEMPVLEDALREAAAVDNEFLKERHPGMALAFRSKFQAGIEARIAGLKTKDAGSLNSSVALRDEWVDWFEANKRETQMPRPSEVLDTIPWGLLILSLIFAFWTAFELSTKSAASQMMQGARSIICFALIGWAFWSYGWKIGLLELLIIFCGSLGGGIGPLLASKGRNHNIR